LKPGKSHHQYLKAAMEAAMNDRTRLGDETGVKADRTSKPDEEAACPDEVGNSALEGDDDGNRIDTDDDTQSTFRGKGWPKTIGEGKEKGYIYKWSGNVAHLDDDKMVSNLTVAISQYTSC
jgi:hypothetical protein